MFAACIASRFAAASSAGNDFGHSGDGATLNTEAINRAIRHVHAAGGGRVRLEHGVYVTGRVELLSNIELYVGRGAFLNSSCNIKDWTAFTVVPPPGCGGCVGGTCDGRDGGGGAPCSNTTGPCVQRNYGGPLIWAQGQRNISLRGGGTLDGCGGSWWHAPLPMGENRGRLIALVRCDDITIEDVTLRNSVSH